LSSGLPLSVQQRSW